MPGTYYETDGLFTVLLWAAIWIPYIVFLCRLIEKREQEDRRRKRLMKREILRARKYKNYK